MWVYSRKKKEGESTTHIKYNLLDLVKMNNIKSQDVRTHEELVCRGGGGICRLDIRCTNLWLAHSAGLNPGLLWTVIKHTLTDDRH